MNKPLSSSQTHNLPIDYPQQLKKALALRGEDLINYALALFGRRLAVLSSFGTESALQLDMVSKVGRDIPVLFIDTGKLHKQTLEYKDQLVSQLRLSNVRVIRPDPANVAAEDPNGTLWNTTAWKSCCDLRKDRPLELAFANWDNFVARVDISLARTFGDRFAIINGIKGHHGGNRSNAKKITTVGNRTDFSPLFDYSKEEIAREFEARGLPKHPLAPRLPSVGCEPCTKMPDRPGDFRSGRMGGEEGNYCGINLSDRQPRTTPRPGGC